MVSTNTRSLLERPQSLLVYLIALDLFFVIIFPLSIFSGSWTLAQWFDLNGEVSIPTWFATSQLLVAGLLILVTSSYRTSALPTRTFCMIVGLGLIFISADEASLIHERLTPLAARHAEFVPLFPGDHGAWISIYAVIGLLLTVFNLRNIIAMWTHFRRPLVVVCAGFTTLVAGGVAAEIAGYYSLFASDTVQLMVEEGLEMVGGSIMFVGAATFLNSHASLQATQTGKRDAAQKADQVQHP